MPFVALQPTGSLFGSVPQSHCSPGSSMPLPHGVGATVVPPVPPALIPPVLVVPPLPVIPPEPAAPPGPVIPPLPLRPPVLVMPPLLAMPPVPVLPPVAGAPPEPGVVRFPGPHVQPAKVQANSFGKSPQDTVAPEQA